jgi:hypothetical protein
LVVGAVPVTTQAKQRAARVAQVAAVRLEAARPVLAHQDKDLLAAQVKATQLAVAVDTRPLVQMVATQQILPVQMAEQVAIQLLISAAFRHGYLSRVLELVVTLVAAVDPVRVEAQLRVVLAESVAVAMAVVRYQAHRESQLLQVLQQQVQAVAVAVTMAAQAQLVVQV